MDSPMGWFQYRVPPRSPESQVQVPVWCAVGDTVGAAVGTFTGDQAGRGDRLREGAKVGSFVGLAEGSGVGDVVGLSLGEDVDSLVGAKVSSFVGLAEEPGVGDVVGLLPCSSDGTVLELPSARECTGPTRAIAPKNVGPGVHASATAPLRRDDPVCLCEHQSRPARLGTMPKPGAIVTQSYYQNGGRRVSGRKIPK